MNSSNTKRIALAAAVLGAALFAFSSSRAEAAGIGFAYVATPGHAHPTAVKLYGPAATYHGHVAPFYSPGIRVGVPMVYEVQRPVIRYGSYTDAKLAYRVAAAVGGWVKGPSLWQINSLGGSVYVWDVYYRP